MCVIVFFAKFLQLFCVFSHFSAKSIQSSLIFRLSRFAELLWVAVSMDTGELCVVSREINVNPAPGPGTHKKGQVLTLTLLKGGSVLDYLIHTNSCAVQKITKKLPGNRPSDLGTTIPVPKAC